MDPDQVHPPDGMIRRLTIRATLHDRGIWVVSCSAWKCEFPDRNLTRALATLATQIEEHNAEIEPEHDRT